MTKIYLTRKLNTLPNLQSYRLTLEVTSSENVVKSIFVMQRDRDPKNNKIKDSFVALATPTQISDLDENSPEEGSIFYRTHTVDLVGRTLEYIESLFDSIVSEIQSLVDGVDILDIYTEDGLYEITANTIQLVSSMHEHYRLPLFARPCGVNETYIDGGVTYQRVASQNVNLSGWLNTTGSDPAGYLFKYNIARDASLLNVWPPTIETTYKPQLYANGIVSSPADTNVLINTTGIYWKSNLAGFAPWPQDYVNQGDTGSPQTQLNLTLDFIKT